MLLFRIAIFSILSTQAFAQATPDSLFNLQARAEIRKAYDRLFRHQSALVTGSDYAAYQSVGDEHPYFENDDWFNGSVTYGSKVYDNVALQFDLAQQALLLEHPLSGRRIQLVKEKIKSFTLGNNLFVQEQNGFYQVLVDGNVRLLAKHLKSLQQKSRGGRIYPVFQESTKYFLAINENLKAVKSRKSIVFELSQLNKTLAEQLRKRKMRSNSREQMFSQIVEGFNELSR